MNIAPIKLGLPLLGRGGWIGGYIYLENTLKLIRSRLAGEIEAYVFLSPDEAKRHGAALEALTDGRVIIDPAVAHSGRGKSLIKALIFGRDHQLYNLFKKTGIDVVFENASFFGFRPGIPVIAWMPDFQHLLMPEMFSKLSWWRREVGFRSQIMSNRTVMLSSETAREHLEYFYSSISRRSHVVRFAADIDIASPFKRRDEIRRIYDLPERFYFMPNQFWRHKNHKIIIDALAVLKAEGLLKSIPPIIVSGQPSFGQIDHFNKIMSSLNEACVQSHFVHLGLIPYDHVLALIACSERLINPSHFEGWSTPLEEAKALGTPLILSDIPIHREQAPEACFFNPHSIDEASQILLHCAKMLPPRRLELVDLIANQNHRLDLYASALLATLRAAVSDCHGGLKA